MKTNNTSRGKHIGNTSTGGKPTNPETRYYREEIDRLLGNRKRTRPNQASPNGGLRNGKAGKRIRAGE
jgi:hypothetical protein